LSRVEATYQNIDSFEVGITDVDHYFEYLGGISKAVEMRLGSLDHRFTCLIRFRRKRRFVRSRKQCGLETRTKTLNPKWFEGMLKHGFRGVAEIENHVTNTFGWSATADAVDPWIYTEIAQTFLLDETMCERLHELNPYSLESLAKRLVEAHERGYWNPDEAILERLREVIEHLGQVAPSVV